MKKLIALALVLSLSVISIGCGGSTTPSTSKPSGAAGGSGSTASTEATKATEVKKP